MATDKLMKNKLIAYFGKTILFSENQFGFTVERNTEGAMIYLVTLIVQIKIFYEKLALRALYMNDSEVIDGNVSKQHAGCNETESVSRISTCCNFDNNILCKVYFKGPLSALPDNTCLSN